MTDTVEGARKQTGDIDTVLATGGFKVKGWISNKTLKENDNEGVTEMKVFQGDVEEKIQGIEWKGIRSRCRSRLKSTWLAHKTSRSF